MKTVILFIEVALPSLVLGVISIILVISMGCKKAEEVRATTPSKTCYYVMGLDGRNCNLGLAEEGNSIEKITSGAIFEEECEGEIINEGVRYVREYTDEYTE